ncbi:hypothetical protein [Adhaeribacter aquaticus]|nr:hypothetical protein [Adhaeribacter aquaticus]
MESLDLISIALIVLSLGGVVFIGIKEIRAAKAKKAMMYGRKRKQQKQPH